MRKENMNFFNAWAMQISDSLYAVSVPRSQQLAHYFKTETDSLKEYLTSNTVLVAIDLRNSSNSLEKMKKMVELTKEFLERSGIDKVYLCKFVFVPNAKGETRDEFIKRVDEFSQSLMGSESLSPQLSLYYIFDDCESDESFKNGNFGILGKNIV